MYRSRVIDLKLATLLAAALAGCDGTAHDLLAPDDITASHARSTSTYVADVVAGDFTLTEGDAAPLTSTCASSPMQNGWALVYGKTKCLTPELSYEGVAYRLEDDVVVAVHLEKGKDGRITHIRLNGQDVDGPAGIWHNTDLIPVAEPVVPNKAGFTLHVHARNIPIYRFDSHLGGGNRVGIVGYVSIADIVYRAL